MARNPFTPSFGSTPPSLVGRQDLIDDFADALDNGPGSPARATLYTGARGTGKTVMLNAAEDQARTRGWLVIPETATPGLLARIVTEHLPQTIVSQGAGSAVRLTGLTAPAGLGGATWTATEPRPHPGLRTQLVRLLDLLAERGTGVLFTIDEVHRQQIDDLGQICAEMQHAFRENREVAFAAAGLPEAIGDLVSDQHTLTFLRRAERHELGALELDEVAEGLRDPIEAGGRAIGADALDLATEATQGYPFLIQLVGYQIWRQRPDAPEVTRADVEAGVATARRRMGSLVHEPTLATASALDRAFLLAMASEPGPSRMGDLATRLGWDANLTSQYRLRLLRSQVIRASGRGLVDFSLPYLREYLRENAVTLVPSAPPTPPLPRAPRRTGPKR